MKRRLIYLGIVLVIALVVLIIERPDLGLQGDADFEPLVADYDAGGITSIKIDQLVSGVQVKKKGDTWMVADMATPLREKLRAKGLEQPSETVWYAADAEVVKRALGALANVQKGIVASMNPDNQVAYQVAGPIGLHVVLDRQDGTQADIIIGKNSPDHSGSYVRMQGSDEVFLVNKTLAGLFPTALTDWRDRTIWNVEPKKIKSISVVTPKDSYEIVKDKDAWAVIGKPNAVLDKVSMAELLGKLSDMRAHGFAAASDPRAAFKKPALTVSLALDSGEAETLELAGTNNLGQAYARHKGDDQVYLVGSPESLVPADWNELKKQ
jgi:hypothetical protein